MPKINLGAAGVGGVKITPPPTIKVTTPGAPPPPTPIYTGTGSEDTSSGRTLNTAGGGSTNLQGEQGEMTPESTPATPAQQALVNRLNEEGAPMLSQSPGATPVNPLAPTAPLVPYGIATIDPMSFVSISADSPAAPTMRSLIMPSQPLVGLPSATGVGYDDLPFVENINLTPDLVTDISAEHYNDPTMVDIDPFAYGEGGMDYPTTPVTLGRTQGDTLNPQREAMLRLMEKYGSPQSPEMQKFYEQQRLGVRTASAETAKQMSRKLQDRLAAQGLTRGSGVLETGERGLDVELARQLAGQVSDINQAELQGIEARSNVLQDQAFKTATAIDDRQFQYAITDLNNTASNDRVVLADLLSARTDQRKLRSDSLYDMGKSGMSIDTTGMQPWEIDAYNNGQAGKSWDDYSTQRDSRLNSITLSLVNMSTQLESMTPEQLLDYVDTLYTDALSRPSGPDTKAVTYANIKNNPSLLLYKDPTDPEYVTGLTNTPLRANLNAGTISDGTLIKVKTDQGDKLYTMNNGSNNASDHTYVIDPTTGLIVELQRNTGSDGKYYWVEVVRPDRN